MTTSWRSCRATADFGLAQLRARLKGVPAVVGSLVLPREVRQSLAAAEALAMIELAGDAGTREPILVDDHLLDLVLRADPALLERLSTQLLAPLDAVPNRRVNGWPSPCSPGSLMPVPATPSRRRCTSIRRRCATG